jgi:outer membrane protein with beta-barrel domain
MRRMLFAVLAVGVLSARPAAGQDSPRFGLVMGYPAEVGVLWSVSDRVAIRPEVNWTHSSSESPVTSTVFGPNGSSTTVTTTTSEGTTFGVGASALFYLSKRDALRTYVTPRLAYTRISTTIDLALPALPAPLPRVQTTIGSGYTVSGAVGAEYRPAARFGVFGELGLAYGRTTISGESELPRPDATNTSVGLRSGAGVILFF